MGKRLIRFMHHQILDNVAEIINFDFVNIILKSGETFAGTLTQMDQNQLVLKVHQKKKTIKVADIEEININKESTY